MHRFLSMTLLAMGVSLMSGAHAGTLNVGDKAPPLKVVKWAKGAPVKSFAPGKVYVVEFWATWCGPCRVSIPHLTELQKKYKGKATFIGVSIWENQRGDKSTAYQAKVASFVKDMGAKMDYTVAMDGVDGVMAKTWMEAAGENGIPSAFIVDKNGRIAWIGHPMSGLDEALGQVVAGTFNAKKFAQERSKEQAAEKKREAAFGKIQTLLQQGKSKEAIGELDKLMAGDPAMENQLAGLKYNLLLQNDEPAAYDYARKLMNGAYKSNAMGLNMLAWNIVGDEMSLKSPDYDLALEIAERAVDASKGNDPYILDTLAVAHYKKGNTAKAIEIQMDAIAKAKQKGGVEPQVMKEMEERLEMFKSKKD